MLWPKFSSKLLRVLVLDANTHNARTDAQLTRIILEATKTVVAIIFKDLEPALAKLFQKDWYDAYHSQLADG